MATDSRNLLRQLATAFLNATLMLLIILIVTAIILLTRVQNFTADTVSAALDAVGQQKTAAIHKGFDELKTMRATLGHVQTSLKERCRDGENTPKLDELRNEIKILNENIVSLNRDIHVLGEKAADAAIDGVADAMKDWLGVSKPASSPQS